MPLSAAELRQLDGTRLTPRKSFAGRVRGERTTQKKGVSIEFADYREYAEGDDLRHLDWNVLARLDSQVMKTYRDEEDLAVYLLVDHSESMNFGEPPKAEAAQKLAAAIGYVGLNGGDAVIPISLGVREPKRAPMRGLAAMRRLVNWTPVRTELKLTEAIRQFVASSARPGLVVLCSDGMDPDIFGALRTLAGRGHEIFFLQILTAVELDPDIEGDVRLVDCESGQTIEITANGPAVREYKANLGAHNEAIMETTLKLGGRHAIVRSDFELRDVVRDVWRRQGWIA